MIMKILLLSLMGIMVSTTFSQPKMYSEEVAICDNDGGYNFIDKRKLKKEVNTKDHKLIT